MKRKIVLILIGLMIIALSFAFVACKEGETNEANVVVEENGDVVLTLKADDETVIYELKKEDINYVRSFDHPYKGKNVYTWTASIEGVGEIKIIEDGKIVSVDALLNLISDGLSHALSIYPTTYYTKLFLNGAAYKAVQGKVPEAITAIPEKDYRVFKGFSVNSEGKDIIVTDKNGKFIGEWQYDYNELTLNPEYDLASISLNLDYGHDREKDADVPDIVQIGSELNYLRLLGLEGHNFLGWYSDDNVRLVDEKGSFIYGATLTDENASAFGVTKTGNGYVLNIKANWEPKKYKVYLFYNGVQVGEPEVTYGEVIGESLDLNAINIGESYCELLWEGYDLLKKMPSVEIRLNVKEVFHHTDADGKRIWECISGKCVRCNKTINAYVNHNLDSTAPCADKTCAICGTIFPSEAEHEFSESVIGVSCVDKACLVCGYVEEKTAEHVLDEAGLPDCRCKNCGKNLINDIGYYRQGSKVYYGSYPTTLLTEDKDAVTLRKLATDRPTFDNDNGWTAFDYGTTDDFSNVWYKDVVLDSEKYRGIYIDNGYRENNDYQRANGYSLCNTYWFRYEALSWTIVDEIDGKVTLISDRILDAGNATDAESIFASFSEVVFGGNTNECFESAALPTAQIAATVTDYAKAMGIKTENVRLLTEGDLSAENCSGILPVIRMELFPHRNVFTIKADRGIKYFYYRVGTTGEFEISSTSISFPVDEKDYVYYKSVADYGYTVDDDMRNLYVRENKNYTLTLTPTPLNVDISLVGDETFAVDLTVEATFDDGVEITALPQREYYHLIGFYDENNVKVIDSTGKFVDAAEGIVEGGALKKAEPFTLFAKWDLNMYAIYFDGEGGVGDTASFAFVNASEKELPRSSFEKEGYGFAGWNTSGSNEVEYEDGALVYGVDLISALGLSLYDNDSATLKAVWTPNKYVVRFDKNGGSGVQMADEEFVYDVEKVLTKNEYVKTGYVFAGWTYAQNVYADCAKVNNLTSEENAVVTLLAEWDPISYYIEFSAGNGEGDMQKVECVYDTQSTLPKNAFVKTGYVFDRWTCGDMNYADEATIGNLSEVDEAELTFTATWRPCVYTVAYSPAYEGCETTMEPSSLVYDTAIELRANSFEREGYEFIGWSLSETGEIEFEDKASVINLATTDGSVVTLYARWVNNRYTIVYHGNLDGAEDFSATHVYDVSSALAVNTYSKKGYSFAGWDENRLAKQGKYASGEYVANLTSTPDGKVDLYAIWSPIKYTVAYYANGGVGNTYSSSHYYDKSQRLTACKFSLAGYAFVGWSESPDGEPIYTDMQSVVNLRENEDDVVNLYAVWTANDYTVKYVANGGDGQMANTPAKVDVSFNLRENTFIKAGYTFAGWNTYSNAETALYADGETVVNLTLDPSAEFSLYAVWTANDYKVYYAANGGSLPDGQTMDYSTFTYGKRGTLKKNVYYKTGYSFDGWTLNDNVYDNEASVLNLSEGENVTLTAKWSPNTYTVNFLSNGGSGVEMASEEFAYDEEKALTLCSYNRIGYTFVGWALSANGEAIYDDGQEVINLTADSNAALNIYAVWSANTYTIKFNANSGVGSTPSQPFVYDGAQALNACGYTKVGYHFIGWALSSGGEKVYSNGETVINVTAIDKATVDLYAVWENNTYSFAYHANGGVGETYIQTFTYDVKGYVSDCNFTKTGYHFVGWGESADSVEPAHSTGDEIFNLTAIHGETYSFYAIWAKNTYTVNYHANGGVGETYSTTQTYDEEFTLSSDTFVKSGYRIVGWDYEPNVYEAIYFVNINVKNLSLDHNGFVDLYAVWESTLSYEFTKDNTYKVTGLGDYLQYGSVDLEIPSSFKGKAVTEIAEKAFYNVSTLLSVVVPDSVTSIGYSAFSYCVNLMTISLPSSIRVIGQYTFYGCRNLIAISIPDSVTFIEFAAFSGCTSLSSVVFGEESSLEFIDDYAFEDCSNLTSFTIPSKVKMIGTSGMMLQYPFEGCYKLVEVYNKSSLTITKGLKENSYLPDYGGVGRYAKEIYYEPYVSKVSVDENGYILYTDNDEVILLGYRGTDTILLLPNTITSINDNAFYGNKNIISVTIPASVNTIGNLAFYNCEKLIEVCNQSSLDIVSGQFVNGCVAYYAKNVYTNEIDKKLYVDDDEFILFDDGDDTLLIGYTGIECNLTIPSSVSSIYPYAFYGKDYLKTVVITDNVLEISNNAFSECANLTTVVISDNLTSLGLRAFMNCNALSLIDYKGSIANWCSIEGLSGLMAYGVDSKKLMINDNEITGALFIPDSVTKINEYAFYGIKALTAVYINGCVTTIGAYSFSRCSCLQEITLLNGVESIGSYAFSNCIKLGTLVLPNSLTTIGNNAFVACKSLTSVEIPINVSSIENNAFYNCNKLIEIYNRSALTIEIGSMENGCVAYYAKNIFVESSGKKSYVDEEGFMLFDDENDVILLSYMGSESELIIPSSVTKISANAFYGIESITSVTIPASIIEIGWDAFYGCTSLKSTNYNGTLTQWCNIVFNNETANPVYLSHNLYINGNNILINVLYIPNVATEIKAYTFVGATQITGVNIPSSVTEIGYSAFRYCEGLRNVSIANGVSSLGGYAFGDCTKLGSLFIPDSVTTIETHAFANCIRLNSVSLSSGVIKIGSYAFSGCSSLLSIVIPDSVTSLGVGVFSGCSSLISLSFGVQRNYVMISGYGKESLLAYYFGSVRYEASYPVICSELGFKTFYYLPYSLRNITVTKGGIYPDMFDCVKIESIYIGENVNLISNNAFSGCTELKSIIVDENNPTYYSVDNRVMRRSNNEVVFEL